jgi:hypothetical protein
MGLHATLHSAVVDSDRRNYIRVDCYDFSVARESGSGGRKGRGRDSLLTVSSVGVGRLRGGKGASRSA